MAPWNIVIPATGTVSADDFEDAAKAALKAWEEGEGKDQPKRAKDQADAAAAAAVGMVTDGHIGGDHVYAVISGNGNDDGAFVPGRLEDIVSVAVYQRGAPAAPAAEEGSAEASATSAEGEGPATAPTQRRAGRRRV